MIKRLEQAMQAEMTRKEFLTALGIGLLSIAGINTLLRLFSGHSGTSPHGGASTYGGSSYGGPKG
jgi:hypothetical protein